MTMKPSTIGWADYSGADANFVLRGKNDGDCECSLGCKNCYVIRLDKRYSFLPEITTAYAYKLNRLMTKKFPKYSPKRGAPNKPLVFVVNCGDLFHPNVSDLFILEAIGCLGHRPDVDWAILTKRPERIREVLEYTAYTNIYMGVSCENQAMADRRIPVLLANWKGPKFVSVEPMLEPIQLHDSSNSWLSCPLVDEEPTEDDPIGTDCCETYAVYGEHFRGIDWVICGAESGNSCRPFDPLWAKAIYEDCKSAGIPFFGKQDSDRYPGRPLHIDGRMIHKWPGSR